MHRALALALAASLVASAPAQPKTVKQTSAPAAADPTAKNPDPAAIIRAAREAMAATHALSYTARTYGVGALDGKVPSYSGRVSAARADAGGWRLYIKGEASAGEVIEVGYDGVTARSIREKDKVVIEKDVADESDLAVFLSSQQCRHAVVWEVLGESPLAGDESRARYEGRGTSDGQECDIIFIPAPEKAESEQAGGVQVWIAQRDRLPRRVTRFQPGSAAGVDPKDGRVLELGEFKINAESIAGYYSPEVPSGFRVRIADAAPKPRTTPGAPREATPPADPGLLKVGAVAPEWELMNSEGNNVKLSDLKGKVVLMDFWATWCPPCRAAMPAVQKLHEKYAGKPVAIFGVNCWERGDAAAYMANNNFTYGLLLKADKVAGAYGVTGIPTFYLIGPDGKILHAGSGFGPGIKETIEKKIDEALAAK